MEQVPMRIPFIPQTIKVKFYLSNESADRIIKLSGNPGYNWNLPIIVSSAEGNHTFHFFNRSEGIQKILKYPDNKKGRCVLSNITYKVVQFGENKRNTCRFELKQKIDLNNGTRTCEFIQNLIISLFGLNSTLFVSPYGNPQHLNDKDWIPIKIFDKTHIYGVFKKKSSQLICYNLITRIAYTVSYAVNSVNAKAENKILHINIEGTAQNVTFDLEDATTPLTIDTNFIDTSRRLFQYAGPPHLNLYLPKSFFLPSNGNRIRNEMCLTLILLLLNPLIES
ncbi:unnamed protein product [Leptosia nina]|uniref:Tectonic-1-3 domain-containing protein n=1 Tax=Leptosia nina TaxID=320188 RepID=A0AAV1JMK2_9NEOP